MTMLENAPAAAPAARNGAQLGPSAPGADQSPAAVHSPARFAEPAVVSHHPPAPDALAEARSRARWFFWMWLLFATVVSIGGNVIHAWMTAPATHLKVLAAAAAAVPPAVLLGSTHSVALLIKTRRRGGYRRVDAVVLAAALVLTVGVAACAFAMSFFALRDLMITLGISVATASLWPIAVDLSLICSTLAILTLTSVEDGGGDEPAGLAPGHAAAATAAIAAGSGPSSPAERRLWWESIAAVVQERHPDVRKVAELPAATIADLLRRLYDEGDSQRTVCGALDLHHREVRTIKQTADEVLARLVPPADVAA